MRQGQRITLGELAERTACILEGDSEIVVNAMATLQNAVPGTVSFFSNRKYRRHLGRTGASGVFIGAEFAGDCPSAVLIADDPYLAFARAARFFYPQPTVHGGIHHSAVVSDDAEVDPTASIGAHAVVESGARIGPGVSIGPTCVVGANCVLGEGTRLLANVTLCSETVLGKRVLIHPGAVIGSDGFGFARDGGRWLRIPQVGRVLVGDDVDIGANTTIDRGAVDDTVIESGVILDNQIQIGHNVRLSENTAIAACCGIAGSTHVGRNCIIAGDVGIAGHLEIGDGVFIAAGSKVPKSLEGPGSYGGALPVDADPLWRRNAMRIHKLDEMAKRLARVERRLKQDDDSAEDLPG